MSLFRDLVIAGRAALEAAGIEAPGREAQILAAKAAGIAPERAAISMNEPVPEGARAALEDMLEKRRRGVPVSHILGYRDFFRHRFHVSPQVLDPRPETEVLVLAALERDFASLLDLGTGSGAIALSLLAEREHARAVATDLSQEALEIARGNAKRIGVADRCRFLLSDWFGAVEGRFDLIVSNPPYIAADEMAGLGPELAHEPRMALTDEGDGLGAYRAIAAGAREHLAPGGRLMVEIGPSQGAAVLRLFRAAGLENLTVRSDLDGRDRVVTGEMPAA